MATKSREKALEVFKRSGIPETPMNWHIWKRAFEIGFSFGKMEGEVKILKQLK